MLVRADDGGVDHHVLEVWIAGQGAEHALPHARLRPPVITLEHAVPVAKLFRQLPPVRPRPRNPQYRVHEQAIVPRRPAGVALLAGQ